MQRKDKQPQNCYIVRDLSKNTRRDAVLEKLLIEVDMKMKSFQDTCVQLENNCPLGFDGTLQRSSSFVNKIRLLENSISSKIRNVATALESVGFKNGSVEMWELTMFLLPINQVFGTLVIRRIDVKIYFLQVAELNAVLALVLSLILRGAATFLCIKDRIDSSEDRRKEKFVISNILKSVKRTLESLGSADTLNTDTFGVVNIHAIHDIVQMVQELIVVMAPPGLGGVSPSCIEGRVTCGEDRDLKRFANTGLLKNSENGTGLVHVGPTATEINDDGLVLGINNLNKNCLGKNVAVEAEDGNLIEGCIDENYPSNANDLHLKYDCRKEDDVLNDRSNLLSSDTGRYLFLLFSHFFFFQKIIQNLLIYYFSQI